MIHNVFIQKTVFTLILFFICGIVGAPQSAGAQSAGVNCDAEYEVVMRLRSPERASYMVWDGTYGEMNTDEKIIGGELLSNGHLLLATQRQKVAAGEQLVMVEMDRRGRTVWEAVHNIAGLKSVRHMMRLGTRFVVVADVKASKTRDQIWMGFFNDRGTLLYVRKFNAPRVSMSSNMIAPATKAGHFYMAAAQLNPKTGLGHSVLYLLNAKGHVVSKRAYQLGNASRIKGLRKTPDGGLIAVGWVESDAKKHDGWVLSLDGDMKLKWQQTLSRGGRAHLRGGVQSADGNVIAMGDVIAVDGEQQAVFVFKVEADSGAILWQRYYRDDHKMSARDIIVHDKNAAGRSYSLLFDSVEKQTLETDEFMRVLQVNERGDILDAKNLFYGRGAHGTAMVSGYDDERVVVGYVDVVKEEHGVDGAEPTLLRSKDGLVLAVPAAMPYVDECLSKAVQ